MEVLDFVELQSQRSAAYSIGGMESMRTQAHTVLGLLLGGAGAAGVYALGQIGKPGALWAIYALGAVSMWWFYLAGRLAHGALRTDEVSGPANRGGALWAQIKLYQTYAAEVQAEGGPAVDALQLLREMEIRTAQACAESHALVSTRAADALDKCYRYATYTPIWAMVALAVAGFFT